MHIDYYYIYLSISILVDGTVYDVSGAEGRPASELC